MRTLRQCYSWSLDEEQCEFWLAKEKEIISAKQSTFTKEEHVYS